MARFGASGPGQWFAKALCCSEDPGGPCYFQAHVYKSHVQRSPSGRPSNSTLPAFGLTVQNWLKHAISSRNSRPKGGCRMRAAFEGLVFL